MATIKSWRYSAEIILRGGLLTLLIASVAGTQQNSPSLQITSPANNSIESPTGTVTLTIDSSPSGIAFSQIAIIGPGFVGINVVNPTSLPTQFSLAIPPDADCRVYTLTVDGIPASGAATIPAQLQIDVEHSDPAISIAAFPSSLTFQSLGEQSSMSFVARFTDPTYTNVVWADVTQSTLMSYASSNTSIATVDSLGTVSAIAPGNAVITATYGQGASSFPLNIPVTVLSPRLTASPTSLNFATQTAGTASSPQPVALTNSGTQAITIMASTTGDFSETDNCSTSPLAVGSSCTANVAFSPSGGGARSGALSVANSANTVPTTIALTGTGVVAPYITSLNPTSGSVGTSVTITGVNFGATQGSSTVTLNGTTETPTSWSNTSIVVPVPTGATTGNVVVTVGGVASNGVSFTVATAPTITSINPTSGLAGTSVTITGVNFGATQGTSTVTFIGSVATPTSWSAASIVVDVPQILGLATGNVVVRVGGVASNGVSFTVPCNPTVNINCSNPN